MLLTAEPTPAFSRGSVDITDSVAGGITLAMPAPMTKKITPRTHSGVSRSMNIMPTSAAVTSARPAAQTAFGPNRRTSAALRGAKISWAAANGSSSRPVCSGV